MAQVNRSVRLIPQPVEMVDVEEDQVLTNTSYGTSRTIRRPVFAAFTVRGMSMPPTHAEAASVHVVGGAQRVNIAGLNVDAGLVDLITQEVLPGTGVSKDAWFAGFSDIVRDLAPKNAQLLAKRDSLQTQIDDYHKASKGPVDMAQYKAFLTEIGYLVPEGPEFTITSTDVDPEIATIAGPQVCGVCVVWSFWVRGWVLGCVVCLFSVGVLG